MKKLSLTVLLSVTWLFFAGCGMTLEERFDREERLNKKLESVYITGTKRSEIRSWEHYEKIEVAMERPLGGWDFNNIDNWQIHRAAYLYEKKHNVIVSSCDAYLKPRSLWGFGDIDYLFFDKEERLIGFHRRFLD